MIFELTDSLAEKILFAMENQEEEFVLDVNSKNVIPISDIPESPDEENICSLPFWSSSDGYNLLETFAETLRAPVIRRELKAVLANGRGVFRNYKNVLKKYPEIESRFQKFKVKEMRLRLMDWYNALRESWGLEKLSQESDDYGDLLLSDFVFREYDFLKDENCIAFLKKDRSEELKGEFSGALGQALAHIWQCQTTVQPKSVDGFVCHTQADDFAGCLLYESLDCAEKTAILSVCFVHQNYRGLGIARELLANCISKLKERGFYLFVIADSMISEETGTMLSQMGFEKKGFAFVVNLQQD